ncbi:MAG: retropepsin-like domain-containing protein [Bacteroidetes bacterium]|nr:retropepsin-like domain-containing protein [Bacteroidota bacterium]
MKSVKVPIRILSIEGDGFHLQLKVKINGKNANCIIDTGASKTVFDSERVKRFLKREVVHENERLSTGLGTNSMQSQVVIIERLDLGGFTIYHLPCIMLDLGHVNQTYASIGLEPIDGVIGSDILHNSQAVIDYGKSLLSLLGPKTAGSKRKKPAKKASAKKVTAKKTSVRTAAIKKAAAKKSGQKPARKTAPKVKKATRKKVSRKG